MSADEPGVGMGIARDPIVIGGVVLTLVATVAVYVTGLDPGTSLLTGLTLLALTLVADVLYRFERHNTALEERLERHKNELRREDEVLSALRRASWFGRFVHDAAIHVTAIGEGVGEERFEAEARRCLAATSDRLKRLAEGRLEAPYRDEDVAVYAVREAQERFSALMLLEVDEDWWNDPLESDYVRANYEAVERGVTVERLVIYSPEAMRRWADEVERFVADQRDNGVDVRLIADSAVSPTDQHVQALVDDRFVLEIETTGPGVPDKVVLWADPHRVEEARKRIDRIRQRAHQVTGDGLPAAVRASVGESTG